MDKIVLSISQREATGQKNRFLRRDGFTPCHIYGHNIASETVQADSAALEHVIATAGNTRLVALEEAGKQPRMVFIREIQRTPVGSNVLHVDFYQVKMTEKLTARVPLHLVGEAPALKSKGRLLAHPIDHVDVESLPADIPASIAVDISVLATLDDAIHVKDLPLNKKVTMLTDPDALVAKVNEPTVKAEAEEAGATAEAPEAEGAGAEDNS
ncbi:MAG: 50S ribosomal protein L25 [Dehalogenimonas sp.]|uniref:Large ribosomal subunit protein bL25 n=1 Tax=Candidatus Dehalogenimonas loeffleri TaxID=3127115 RepID=A0ABZ2J502_9CHLR|nr:50S ribosomal protein L25 [Dehalogenimonas sp.]